MYEGRISGFRMMMTVDTGKQRVIGAIWLCWPLELGQNNNKKHDVSLSDCTNLDRTGDLVFLSGKSVPCTWLAVMVRLNISMHHNRLV
jgi:hypothetical protein